MSVRATWSGLDCQWLDETLVAWCGLVLVLGGGGERSRHAVSHTAVHRYAADDRDRGRDPADAAALVDTGLEPERWGPGAKAAPSGPAKLVVGSAPAGVAKQLARSAPPEQQAAVEQAYGLILAKHPQLMRQLGVPSDDLACAVATLLTGSYIAYRDIDFPDALFKVVYEQVRSGLASTPQLAQLDMTKRREIYEQAAIIGTFFAVTHSVLKTQPDPARAASMRAAGRASLEQFLKVDPDRLELTERGFSVRAH